jgi:hypothetical protein
LVPLITRIGQPRHIRITLGADGYGLALIGVITADEGRVVQLGTGVVQFENKHVLISIAVNAVESPLGSIEIAGIGPSSDI